MCERCIQVNPEFFEALKIKSPSRYFRKTISSLEEKYKYSIQKGYVKIEKEDKDDAINTTKF